MYVRMYVYVCMYTMYEPINVCMYGKLVVVCITMLVLYLRVNQPIFVCMYVCKYVCKYVCNVRTNKCMYVCMYN